MAWHTMYRGMDAIDYELDADLVDEYDYDDDDDDLDYDSDGNFGGSLGREGYMSSEDSDDEKSLQFPFNNLRNPKSFPSFTECAPVELYDRRDWDNSLLPPPRHWCYLGEIVERTTVPIRNVLTVRDKDGRETQLSSNFDLEAQFNVKVGSTIAILYAERKYFSFGEYGLRLDHVKFVKIFPCNLETLLRINDVIESETSAVSPKKCQGCGKEEEPKKTKLLRCSRCLGTLYCGKECQTAAWKGGHKHECKVFEAVIELKRSRDWGNKKPRNWIAFGEREEPRAVEDEDEEEEYDSDSDDYIPPEWKDATPAIVKDLQGTFSIASGELLWGQLTSIVGGLLTSAHDFPSTQDRAVPGDTIYTQNHTYRAPAKPGVWKIARINGYGDPDASDNSWLAYHSSCDPVELLLRARHVCWDTRSDNPLVRWVNRYDWGSNCADPQRTARIFADIDADSGWAAAYAREKRLHAAGKYRRDNNPENKRWDRLEYTHASHNIFLVDAINGPNVLKLLARPSELEAHLDREKSSSLFKNEDDADAFGCNLAFIGQEWEFARLIFGEEDSSTFPGEKELVGFWYDADNRYNDSERDWGRKLNTPLVKSHN
ncbi:SET domain-containing protein [Mycena sanguinolenta]|uniref:SET domain-containing protein n=1 Tax=Mycena sanguinolenta TaxID=230812 RepID=A0A8H6XGN2_9AGAR|nr:SET domain-containing protein [Mycena sanguinolenta]